MKNCKNLIFLLFAVSMLMACGGNSNSNKSDVAMEKIDLSEYKIPLVIDAPEGAVVKESIAMTMFSGFGLLAYEIKKDNFIIEVSMLENDSTQLVATLVEREKENTKSNENFDSFVSEDVNGFIYKTVSDGNDDYNFYYAKPVGTHIVEFRNGFRLSYFTLDEVKLHYESAKKASEKTL